MDWRRQARKALKDYPRAKKRNAEEDQAIIAAVEHALDRQREYYNADARLRMVDMVYFHRTHTLYGAALACGYSTETVKKWNGQIIDSIDGGLAREKGPGD